MKATELETLARKAMGVTPGVWEARGGVLLCGGVPMLTASPDVPEWQAEANAEVLAALMNARAETVYALERLPVLIAAAQAKVEQPDLPKILDNAA